MLKITKGLKKKKKGKKSKKNKEEELFKPEELEAYRQQHQQQAAAGETEGATVENEEWKKFQALTSGIDSVLRKTQGDLDRIKSTSFFQRVPPPSEKAAEEEAAAQAEAESKLPETNKLPAREELGVVALSETESEEEGEEEDDIFDTSYIDAVASGEIKLAYIPESPTTEVTTEDDPFDTSIAERAILGPAYNQKGKKLVPLGAAVEVLTGRVELPTCATKRPVSTRRKLRQNDLLLGSFDLDDNGNAPDSAVAEKVTPAVKSLLDDDPILVDAPVDLSGATLYTSFVAPTTTEPIPTDPSKDIVAEFDVIKPEDDDDEFAQLAAESLTKKHSVSQVVVPPIQPQQPEVNPTFEVEFEKGEFDEEEIEVDPFDTTFAENILPGKAELKLIENEILNTEEIPINVEEKFAEIIKSKVSIQLTNPTGERESISSLDRVDESCLNSLQPIHRDLLGGSNTDLSKIGDDPIVPHQPPVDDNLSDYSDPFDTSTVEQISAPGQAELKFIEKEILGEVTLTRTLSDPDFNPRDDEGEAIQIQRPDLLEVNAIKSVVFALPTPSSQPDLLATGEQESVKNTKPLTPYYVRENSLPEQSFPDEPEIEDPFDTSFVSTLAPGKAELKLIENEFITPEPVPVLKRNLSDEDFDPRAAEKEVIQIQQPKLPINLSLPLKEIPKPDLLAVSEEVTAKVLTPAVETATNVELIYSDPFDTSSIACNILPGKAELKLLENELISSQPEPQSQIKRNLTDPEFDPRTDLEQIQKPKEVKDLLDHNEEQVAVKPLTPVDYTVSFDIGEEDDIDPFDTSVADNILPGKTELKLLESELI